MQLAGQSLHARQQMLRWTSLLGALLIVLTLWTGGPARASDTDYAVPVAATSIGHFNGDKDEAPSDSHKGGLHHHALCGEHQVAASSDALALATKQPRSGTLMTRADIRARVREPDAQLRPPIA